MPRHEDPDLRLIASLVALNGVLSKEGAGYGHAAQDAISHADRLVSLLGEKTAAAGYTEERIQRFKVEFFKRQAGLTRTLQDAIFASWRAAWEASA